MQGQASKIEYSCHHAQSCMSEASFQKKKTELDMGEKHNEKDPRSGCAARTSSKNSEFQRKGAGLMPRHQNRLRKQLANSITSVTEGKTTPTQRAPHRRILAREPVTLDGIAAVMELYEFHKDDIEKILTTRKRNPGAYEVLFAEFRHKYTNYEALLKILPRDPLQKSIKDFIHHELRRLGHKIGPGW